jgi:hypothetical protein
VPNSICRDVVATSKSSAVGSPVAGFNHTVFNIPRLSRTRNLGLWRAAPAVPRWRSGPYEQVKTSDRVCEARIPLRFCLLRKNDGMTELNVKLLNVRFNAIKLEVCEVSLHWRAASSLRVSRGAFPQGRHEGSKMLERRGPRGFVRAHSPPLEPLMQVHADRKIQASHQAELKCDTSLSRTIPPPSDLFHLSSPLSATLPLGLFSIMDPLSILASATSICVSA